MTELEAAIMYPGSSQQREEALRALLDQVTQKPDNVSGELAQFLSGFRSDDQIQSALVGLVLRTLHPEGAVPLGILARVFPMLSNIWEPELQRAAIALFAGRSPRQVYEDLADEVGLRRGSELDQFYAYAVLSHVDYESLRDAAADYQLG